MASKLPLQTSITVDSSVVYHSTEEDMAFFGFDAWATKNAIPGCDNTPKIDLITIAHSKNTATWYIEVKDFRYLNIAPSAKNTIDIGCTLEKKILGTSALLSHPGCMPDVKALYPHPAQTNFLFHYELPLTAKSSAYFPTGYAATALQYLSSKPTVRAMFHKMYVAHAGVMNNSAIYPWQINLLHNRKPSTP